jgi:hypothetical protein
MSKGPDKLKVQKVLWPHIQYWVENGQNVPVELVAEALRQDPTELPPESVMLWLADCIEGKLPRGRKKKTVIDRLIEEGADPMKLAVAEYKALRKTAKERGASAKDDLETVAKEHGVDPDSVNNAFRRSKKKRT